MHCRAGADRWRCGTFDSTYLETAWHGEDRLGGVSTGRWSTGALQHLYYNTPYRLSCEDCTGGALSGRCSALALRRTGVAEELPLQPPAALAGGRLTGGRLMLGSGKCSACSSAPAGAPFAHT